MASAFIILCPRCKQSIKASATLEGKKIRCKACSHVFVVKASSAVKAGPAGRGPAAPSRAHSSQEEEANPYGVTDMDESRRCPHCAAAIPDEEAVICLECGYDLETRQHHKTKKTIDITGQDVFAWLLPGILCVLAILVLLGMDIGLIVWKMRQPPAESGFGATVVGCIFLWPFLGSLFGMFYAGRFAIRRLILHPRPEEREKG